MCVCVCVCVYEVKLFELTLVGLAIVRRENVYRPGK